MIRRASTCLVAVLLLAGASCEPYAPIPAEEADGTPAADPAAPSPDPEEEITVDSRLIDAQLRFTFDFFGQVREGQRDANVFISPTSVATALAVVLNGASGETRAAMAEALAVAAIDEGELNHAYRDMLATLTEADPELELVIASSLWARQDITFRDSFLAAARDYFDARAESLDFTDPGAADTINAWVREQTRERIERIVDEIRPLDVLFVLNAVYFKGRWSRPFDPELTEERQFHFPDEPRNHPLMHQRGKFAYFETDDFQAVSLPYGDDRRFRFDLFLPREGTTLDDLVAELDADRWRSWIERFGEREGRLALPRFRLEEKYRLNDALIAMGMGVAFDPAAADLSRLSSARTYIDRVDHKTFVEVTEEGTEAAAVTAVVVGLTAVIDRPEPFRMIVDRPFLCAIRDHETGLVLFLGTVVEPERPGGA